MKSLFRVAGLILVIAGYVSCKSSSSLPDEEVSMEDKMELIRNKSIEIMGSKAQLSPNQDSSLWLCTKEEIPTTFYGVIHEDGHIVLEKKSVYGTVEWHDENSLILSFTPGRIEGANRKRTKIIQLNQG